MVGIISYAAYVPLWRLSRSPLLESGSGEKAIAGFDEDSITMGVAATMNCLNGNGRREIDGLFFSTTTSPYKEKSGATIIATAADLRRNIITADFSNSLRAGTIALRAAIDAVKSGSVKQVLVVVADCRLGAPGSTWEASCGDGAAAFLIGESEDVVAEIEASYSVCDEIMDIWRAEDDRFIRSAEERFIAHEGHAISREAIAGLMKKFNFTEKDFTKAVFGVPGPKTQAGLAKALGFDVKKELQDSMFFQLGDTGAAYSLMLLQAALEDAKKDDRFLLLSYGNGSDAISVKITGQIEKTPKNRGIRANLASKKNIDNYKTYTKWRGLLPLERPPRPLGLAAPPAIFREVEQNFRLHGLKCKACGTVQYPPQAVCTKCHAKDQFERIGFSDKRGRLFTFSIDYLTWALELPTITAIVNFEGGGRIQMLMTDTKKDELEIDMPLEMSFRKVDFREGINIYAWKCVPVRYSFT